MIAKIKTSIKHVLSRWLYRHPAPSLKTERLYLYLDALYQTRNLSGAVVEVGCFQGGTTAFAHRFLQAIGCPRRYVCVDTFGGFPKRQFTEDEKLGTESFLASAFSANSKSLVRKILDRWGCSSVELIQADIVMLDDSLLPEKIAVALIDVDIAEPTFTALKKIAPRMVSGGFILIDDCDMASFKGARIATEKFAPNAQYEFGMGIISIPSTQEQSA